MPREFVYALTLDDSQILAQIQKIDAAILGLGTRAGSSLRSGSGIAASFEKEADHIVAATTDAARKVERVQKDSGDKRVDSEKNVTREAERALRRLARVENTINRARVREERRVARQKIQIAREAAKQQQDIISQADAGILPGRQGRTEGVVSRVRGSADADAAKESAQISRQQNKVRRETERSLRRQAQLENTLNRARIQGNRRALQSLNRTLASFPIQARQVQNLTNKYGDFTVVLGKTGSNLSAVQRDFNKIISSSRGLTNQTSRLNKEFGQIPLAVNKIKQSVPSGGLPNLFRIGVLLVGLRALGSAFRVTTRAAKALVTALIIEPTKVASAFDGIERSLSAVFGSLDVGSAVFQKIRRDSVDLGADLTQVVRRLLPFVDSLDQARELGQVVSELGRFQPEQGTQGAILAINDALAGQLRPLRERFEIPVESIREAQKQFGNVDGLLIGLSASLDDFGASFEVLGDTADANISRAQEEFKTLQSIVGAPILDVLNSELKEFLAFVEANRDELEQLAGVAGDALAQGILALSDGVQNFLDNVDFDELNKLLADAAVGLKNIGDNIGDIDVTPFFELLETARDIAGRMREAGTAIILFKGALDDLGNLNPLDESLAERGRSIGNALVAASQAASVLSDEFDKASEAVIKNNAAVEDSTEGFLNEANAILAVRAAIKERERLQSEQAESQIEFNEKQIEQQKELASETLQQQRALANSLVELSLDTSDRRIKINLDTVQEIAKNNRKFAQSIRDSSIKLNRDLEDEAIDQGRKLADIDTEEAEKRTEIEEEFQRKLRDIRNKFDQDALEAILANDAVRLRQIRRRQDFELADAEQERQDDVSDIGNDFEEKRREANLEAERGGEDARLSRDRRSEDLKQQLIDDLNEIRISTGLELAALVLSETNKRSELNRQHSFRLGEQAQQNREVLAELQLGLDAQLIAIQAQISTVNNLRVRQRIIEIQNAAGGIAGAAAGGFVPGISNIPIGTTSDSRSFGRTTFGGGFSTPFVGRRQFGGSVLSGQDFIVGENGPEVVRFPATGLIEPNLSRFRFSPPPNSGLTTIDNSRTVSADVSLSRLTGLSPVERAEVINIVSNFMQRAIE